MVLSGCCNVILLPRCFHTVRLSHSTFLNHREPRALLVLCLHMTLFSYMFYYHILIPKECELSCNFHNIVPHCTIVAPLIGHSYILTILPLLRSVPSVPVYYSWFWPILPTMYLHYRESGARLDLAPPPHYNFIFLLYYSLRIFPTMNTYFRRFLNNLPVPGILDTSDTSFLEPCLTKEY